MEKGEFELAQILLFPILKLVLSQPHCKYDYIPAGLIYTFCKELQLEV